MCPENIWTRIEGINVWSQEELNKVMQLQGLKPSLFLTIYAGAEAPAC